MELLPAIIWIVSLIADLAHRQRAGAQCPEPAPVPYTYRALTAAPQDGSWTSVNYTCYYGYRHIAGSLHRACGNDGTYSGQPPQCTLDCGDPKIYAEPNVTWNGTLAGSIATAGCDIKDRATHGRVVSFTCNPRFGQWDRPDSSCRYGVSLTNAWQSSTFESKVASLAVDLSNKTCSLTSPELTPSWSGEFDTAGHVMQVLKFTVDTNLNVDEVSVNIIGGPIAECRSRFNLLVLEGDSTRVSCLPINGMFPYGTGLVVKAHDIGTPRQLEFCEAKIMGRIFSDRCFNPPIFPRMKLLDEDGTNNYVIGSEVTYACAEGFYYLGGDGLSKCDIYKAWSAPALKCRAWPNHAAGSAVDMYSNDRFQSSVTTGELTSDDDEDRFRLTIQYSKTKFLRVILPDIVEVDVVTVKVAIPKNDPADLATLLVGVDIVTSADNSSKQSCGREAIAASRVVALGCPSMPWGRAVDVIFTRNFVNDVAVWIHEIRVFGRREHGDLECLRTESGAEYKGRMAVSRNGFPCLAWSTFPAVTDPASYTGDGIADNVTTMDDVIRLFPDVSFANVENFCRNPGGFSRAPFCYVSSKRKDMCSLIMCDQMCNVYPDGVTYQGPVNSTGTGQPCLAWDSSAIPPVRRFQLHKDFSGGNPPAYPACRNPGSSYSEAWCYFLLPDGQVDFEACPVPSCPTILQFAPDTQVSAHAAEFCYVNTMFQQMDVVDFDVIYATQDAACNHSGVVTAPSYFCLVNGVLMGLTHDCSQQSSSVETLDTDIASILLTSDIAMTSMVTSGGYSLVLSTISYVTAESDGTSQADSVTLSTVGGGITVLSSRSYVTAKSDETSQADFLTLSTSGGGNIGLSTSSYVTLKSDETSQADFLTLSTSGGGNIGLSTSSYVTSKSDETSQADSVTLSTSFTGSLIPTISDLTSYEQSFLQPTAGGGDLALTPLTTDPPAASSTSSAVSAPYSSSESILDSAPLPTATTPSELIVPTTAAASAINTSTGTSSRSSDGFGLDTSDLPSSAPAETTASRVGVTETSVIIVPSSSFSLSFSSAEAHGTSHTWPTTTTTTMRTAASTKKSKLCACQKSSKRYPHTSPPAERQKLINDIEKELTVEAATLSNARRRKESAIDERASSQTMGLLGVLTLTLLLVLLVASDAVTVLIHAGRVFPGLVPRAFRRTGVQ